MSIQNAQQDWFGSTVGQYLQEKEQALYDMAVVDLFGFNALQMGELPLDLLRNSRIPNRYQSSTFKIAALNNHLYCEDDFLPFADMSLDLLLLPHRLEFSERPHQVLREAARVMMPEGHLLISGFNSISTWGIKAGFKKILATQNTFPWNGQFIALTRMKDWLALLGFEIALVEMCCHVPPFEQARWQKRCAFMDEIGEKYCAMLGGVYFIVAKKRVAGMTSLKPNWKKPVLATTLITRPTSSSPSQYRAVQSISAINDNKYNK